jgi:hypothetical protein
MPPLPTRLTRTYPIPCGGVWYPAPLLEEAIALRGVLVDIQVSAKSTLYGVYSSQDSFCSHAAAFLKKNPTAHTTTQVERLCAIHTQMTNKVVKSAWLPIIGAWFQHELGALTAYTLKPKAYFVKLFVDIDDIDFDWNDENSYDILYGVFDSPEQWCSFRFRLHSSYKEPQYPFDPDTYKFDRCRCTLLGVPGALIREPKLNRLSKEDILMYIGFLPATAYWFDTREDALMMGGFTVEYQFEARKLYAVYFSSMQYCFAIGDFVDELPRNNRLAYKLPSSSVILNPEMYGVVLDEWNPRNIEPSEE